MAHEIGKFLINKGEEQMNNLGKRLADEQVRFLEQQVGVLNTRFEESRKGLLDYQNEQGLFSPTGTVESINAVVASLEAQLTELKAKKTTLASFQSQTSPEVVRITTEIESLKEQIDLERARMAQSSGGALNVISSEYQTLELKAKFAQESYSAALAALENTRIEAARKLKQVSILQEPTLPEYPVEPERMRNSIMFAVVVIFLTLIMQMLILIIKEHRD
jgi:capsular polysaccharide transport system permease protein